MNCETPPPDFLIRDMPADRRGNFQLCSTLIDTVGHLFKLIYDVQLTSCVELSIATHLNEKLVPPHARAALKAQGLDIDNFTPLSKDEMIARLD